MPKNESKYITKSHLFIVWEQEKEGRAPPFSISAGKLQVGQMKVFAALHMSMNVCKSPLSIDFRLTNKFQQVSKFANTESVNDEDRLYLHLPRFDVQIKGHSLQECSETARPSAGESCSSSPSSCSPRLPRHHKESRHSPSFYTHPILHIVLHSEHVILCLVFKFFLIYSWWLSFHLHFQQNWPGHHFSLTTQACLPSWFILLTPSLLLGRSLASASPLSSSASPLPHWNIPNHPSRLLLKTFLKLFLAGINISLFLTSITILFLFSWSCHFYTLLWPYFLS